MEALWFRNSQIVGSGASVARPTLFGMNLGVGLGKAFPRLSFGFMCLVVCVAVAWAVARLRTSSLRSALLAVRANERSASGIGVSVVWVKVLSFAIASFIAGLGRSLLAYRRGIVTWESFSALGGLTMFATAYLAGVTSVYGGTLARRHRHRWCHLLRDRPVDQPRQLVPDHQRHRPRGHAREEP